MHCAYTKGLKGCWRGGGGGGGGGGPLYRCMCVSDCVLCEDGHGCIAGGF